MIEEKMKIGAYTKWFLLGSEKFDVKITLQPH
jgi:hypothetical protein